MGTRNLTCVVLNGKYKVAQYGQWDGYPSGQGRTIHQFLTDPAISLNCFRKKVSQCKKIGSKELGEKWIAAGAQKNSDWVSFDVSVKFKETNLHLSRDCGAEVLSSIYQSENGLALKHDLGFAADSLFCEYAYVIDLDNNKLEVYAGFNKSPLTENDRFFSLQNIEEARKGNGYYPVRLAIAFSLTDLPSEKVFIARTDLATCHADNSLIKAFAAGDIPAMRAAITEGCDIQKVWREFEEYYCGKEDKLECFDQTALAYFRDCAEKSS